VRLEKGRTVHIVEMMSLVTKLLGPPEEVATCSPSPNHAHRWMIFESQHFKVYLHHSANDGFSDGLVCRPLFRGHGTGARLDQLVLPMEQVR